METVVQKSNALRLRCLELESERHDLMMIAPEFRPVPQLLRIEAEIERLEQEIRELRSAG